MFMPRHSSLFWNMGFYCQVYVVLMCQRPRRRFASVADLNPVYLCLQLSD